MKNLIAKIISILVIMLMVINSSLMLVISTAIDAVQSIIDESKINAIYELNLEKYVNYKVGDTHGLMVQANLKTGIEYQDGQEHVPIEATNVILKTPKVNEEYPEKVEVVVKSTKLTNGDENGKDFNFSYNKDNGEIKLITENKADENGNVYSENVADARDEYQINLYYSSNCYNDKNEKRELDFSGKLYIGLKKDDNKTIKTQDISQKFEVTENVSGLISTNVTTSDIYNGYIRSNVKNNTTYRTEYTENLNVQVSYKEIADEVKINTKNLFVNNKDKEIETEEIVYKSTKISKGEVLNELGENGTLQIFDKGGNCLAEINKDSETDENGYVTINYENELTELTFKLSRPEKIGEINVQNVKQIKETMKDTDVTKVETKNQISCINNVKKTEKVVDESTGEEQNVETVKQVEFYNFEDNSFADIKNAESDVELSVDNVNWTNNVQNDVTFTANLVTSGPEYELFSNPVIQIKLPQEVEKVILGDVALLYGNSLNIKNAKVIDQKGYKILNIELNGTQNKYCLNSIVAGANVVIPATVIISKDAETNDVPVGLTYYNNGKEIETKDGQVKINSITNDNTRNVLSQSAEEENVDISINSKAQVGSQVLNDGDTVYEEQVIKYTVKVTNNTQKDVTGIKISGEVPDGTVYATIDRGTYWGENYEYVKNENVKEYVFNSITDLKAGETKEESYEVVVKNLEGGTIENNISNKIKTVVNNNKIKEDTLNNVVKKAELNIEVKSYIGRDQPDSFYYDVFIKNMSDHELKNIEVNSIEFQKEMNYNIEYLGTDDNSKLIEKSYNDRILKFKLDSLSVGATANIKFNLTLGNFDENINEQIVKMSMIAQAENTKKYWSNENIRTAYPQYVTITQSCEKEGEKLKYGEEIEYKVNVKNESKTRVYVNVQDYLPDGLEGISAEYDKYVLKDSNHVYTEYDINEEENLQCDRVKETINLQYQVNGKTGFDSTVLIPAGKTLTFVIKAKAGFVTETKEVSNFATVYGDYITSKTSNIIKVYVLANDEDSTPDPDNPNNPDNPDNPDRPDNPDNPNPTPGDDKTYDISGTVWVDSNKNGQRDSGEQLLSDVIIKLYDADSNAIVKKKDGTNTIIKTNSNGKYDFTNVKKGNYLVLFEFDTGKYAITDYKKNGVREEINSDAILKSVAIDGEEKSVGLTDKLSVKNSNIENIDLGLVEKEEFDMSLNKSILNLKLTYDGTEKEYNYNESKLVKVEIPAKKIDGASIEVEYQLEIKNEGNADGYVNEIVDYIPEGFTFDSSKNSGWTKKGTNMVIYNGISGIVIKTGESKKIILYLTRSLTSNTIGTLTNKTEINKSISVNGTKDIDSTEGNKNESEDDFSQAQVIISVKTGIVRNILIFIIILLVILFSVYMVKKYKFKGTIMFLFVLIMGSGCIFNQVFALDIRVCCITGETRNFHADDGEENHAHRYYCIDSGHPQCGKAAHYYTYLRSSSNKTGSSGPTLQKSISISTQDSNNISISQQSNGYCRVGPYKVSVNYGGKISISGSATKTNGTKYNFFAGGSDNTQSGNIVTSGIQKINYFNVADNGTYSFYVYVDNSTTKINDVKVTVDVDGVYGYSEWGTTATTYYCSSVAAGGKKTHNGRSCKETDGGADYTLKGTSYACQRMRINGTYSNNWTSAGSTSTNFGSKDLVGQIEVIKKDKDTGAVLNNAKIRLTKPGGGTEEKLTNGSGKVTFSNLLAGKYKVEEISTPSGYNLGLQDDSDKKKDITVTAGKTEKTELKNKQYGNLKVTKKDEDTGNTSLGEIKLSGVQFKLYVLKNNTKYYLKEISPNKYSYSDFSETDKNKAKTLTTDSNAQFEVDNLPVYEGKNKITYYIEEYALPDNLSEYYKIKTDPDTIQLVNGTTQTKDVKNKQIYLDVSGYVWEDSIDKNKQSTRNDLYDADRNETLINGITVRLKNTKSETLQTTTTGSQGEYMFRKVKIDELSNYYIEFEYNGLKYQNVTKKLDKDNGSKAVENTTLRTDFNNSYSTISGGIAKNSSGTKGYSLDQNGNITNSLVYTNGTYSSSLVQNTAYNAESTKNSVSPQKGSMGAVIKANTKDAEYSLDKWKAGVTEITNVNLGIAERGQPDLAIVTDLNHMDMTINGYEHRYNFAQRASYINAGLPDKNVNDAYNSVLDGFSVFVKNGDNNYRNMTYSRGVYDSYIAFTKDNSNDEARLKIYLTYKIALKNESSIPFVKVKSLKNYSDAQLDFIDSYIEDGTNTDKKVIWSKVGTTNDSVRNIWQSGEVDAFIEPGKMATVYLTYELNTNAIISLADLQANGGEVYVVGNTTEITAYSSYDSNKNAYAGIDTDSAPENISYGDISTYEDDTDSTPDLHIKRKTPKSISGLVFEDEANLTLTKERIGDGKYEQGNNGVNDVKVELVNFDNGSDYSDANVITLYTLGDGGNVIKTPADTKTTSDGRFEFVGIIPGEYVTKYTYGKKGDMQSKIITKNVTTQDYKSTIITNDKFKQAVQNRSEYWYQDTELENCSSALDDWNRRSAINQNLKYNSYTVKDNYDNNSDVESNHYMIATTGKMTFPIEDKKDQTTNYDYVEPSRIYNIKFGIVERPRQSLEVNKEISYIKLTLQNGTVLVEGDPRTTTMNYVTYPQNGILKVEADNNLIQGSTLQVEYTISVKNKSETDYNTESYYKYGTPGNTPVSLTVNSIVDYMDEGLISPYNESSPDWKLKEGVNIKNSLSQKAYDVIKNRKNILLNEWNKEIRQNETQYLKVEANKIVSASDDNLYENYTEILSSTSDVGRFYGEEIGENWKNYTPGNYDLTNDTHESDDNGYDHISRATLTIVPPTGSENHVIYYIIGISCLIVIAGGVVIIKKFVL